MKTVFAFVLIAGLIACTLATEKDDSSEKNTKDATKVPSSTPATGDKITLATAPNNGDASSTTERSGRKFCTREYKPVCGSDGKTYTNQCEFDNAKGTDSNLSVTKKEAC